MCKCNVKPDRDYATGLLLGATLLVSCADVFGSGSTTTMHAPACTAAGARSGGASVPMRKYTAAAIAHKPTSAERTTPSVAVLSPCSPGSGHCSVTLRGDFANGHPAAWWTGMQYVRALGIAIANIKAAAQCATGQSKRCRTPILQVLCEWKAVYPTWSYVPSVPASAQRLGCPYSSFFISASLCVKIVLYLLTYVGNGKI